MYRNDFFTLARNVKIMLPVPHTGISLIQDQPSWCLKKWFIFSLSGIFTAIKSHCGLLVYSVISDIPPGWAQPAARSSKKQCDVRRHGAAHRWKRMGPSWEQPASGFASSLSSQARLVTQNLAKPDTRHETSAVLLCIAPCDPLHHYSIR